MAMYYDGEGNCMTLNVDYEQGERIRAERVRAMKAEDGFIVNGVNLLKRIIGDDPYEDRLCEQPRSGGFDII